MNDIIEKARELGQMIAESDEIKAYLESISVPFLEGCLLVGLRKYR